MPVTYDEYNELCEKFRDHSSDPFSITLRDRERHLIFISLIASKAQLKETKDGPSSGRIERIEQEEANAIETRT